MILIIFKSAVFVIIFIITINILIKIITIISNICAKLSVWRKGLVYPSTSPWEDERSSWLRHDLNLETKDNRKTYRKALPDVLTILSTHQTNRDYNNNENHCHYHQDYDGDYNGDND